MHERLVPASRLAPLRARRSWGVALIGCGVLALAAGCGSAAAVPGTAAVAAAAPSASSAGASRTAYVACLREHGADVSTAKPTAAVGARKGTGAIPAAAREACTSLRPHAAQKNTAVEAFDACMSAHGETI